jgi:hypothetical protein
MLKVARRISLQGPQCVVIGVGQRDSRFVIRFARATPRRPLPPRRRQYTIGDYVPSFSTVRSSGGLAAEQEHPVPCCIDSVKHPLEEELLHNWVLLQELLEV